MSNDIELKLRKERVNHANLTSSQYLYMKIFNELPKRDIEDVNLSDLMRIIEETLTAREEKVIRLRFGFGCGKNPRSAIGKEFGGVSERRIKQIEDKALRKLRLPTNAEPIKFLFMSYAELYGQIAELERHAQEQISALNDEIIKLCIENHSLKSKLACSDIGNKEICETDTEEVIEFLDLSERALNCLNKAGIQTIKELVNCYNKHNLMNIRNLGKKTFLEIESRLNEFELLIEKTE